MPPAQTSAWRRPVPMIGDPTAASERAADPAGWAFPAEVRTALSEVIAARRDVRRFRPDPVSEELLHEVLDAAHRAPSVGHSQPWRFIVVTEAATRDRAALLADRERLRQAAALEPDRRRRLLDLQLEGIREAPLGIVVACDRRAPAAGVLGRATFQDTDLWSCACAVQNLWLAARAHGLGLGWVTLFRPEDLADLLGLPVGVETLGWLCLGWPDERPPAPGLERAGWSRRVPVDEVIIRERWPDDEHAPAAPLSHLRAPDQAHVVAARDQADRLLTPPGSLGVLDRAVDRVVALGDGMITGGTLLLVAADHPVAALGVSAYPQSTTSEVFRAAVAGESLGALAARSAGLSAVIVDAGVVGGPFPEVRLPETGGPVMVGIPDRPRGDLVHADALRPDDVQALILQGRTLGEKAARTGLVALGEVGIGNTTVAAALCCVLLDLRPEDVVGLGAGADSAMVQRKAEVVAAAVDRARSDHGELLADPLMVLAAVGGPEFAVLAGVTLGAAQAGAPIVLDGLATSLAALIAVRQEPAVAAHLIAGQVSRERAHRAVVDHLGLEPLLDLRLRAGEGVGACLASGVLLQGLALRRDTGRVDH